jgi:predicted O-methyltransferase YrrM
MIKGAFEDKYLQSELDRLITGYDIKTIVETGTYKGWSTNVLAKTGKKIITIEIDSNLHNIAKNFNNHHSNIDFYLGSSQEVIEKIIPVDETNILFFLDAHWGEYWPILDELRIIKEKRLKPVILVHDFYVPDEHGAPKFGFDRYRNQNLDFLYVKPSMDLIYGNDYRHYCVEESEIGAGVGVFVPQMKRTV